MKLLIALITHDRLAYTKRTMKSLLDTIDVPYYLVVVDNNSTDGTQKWLETHGRQDLLIENPNNWYPGKATNIGWERGLREFSEADFLMRCDNDMEFEPNWATKAEKYFNNMPVLGQLGLDNTALDSFKGDERYLTTIDGYTTNAWPGNVGGPCIIRREAYDRGARYDETPWQDLRENENSMITPQEDVKFSLKMHNYQFIFGHPTEKLAQTFADETNRHEYKSYYSRTFKQRGYDDPFRNEK